MSFDPYYEWLGIPASEQPASFYRLLGLTTFEANATVISNAADRMMAHLRPLQLGKHAELAQRLLNELATARICLLDPAKKVRYDAQLEQSRSDRSAGQVCDRVGQNQRVTSDADALATVRVNPRSPSSPSVRSRRQPTAWQSAAKLLQIVVGGLAGIAMAIVILQVGFGVVLIAPGDQKPAGAVSAGSARLEPPANPAVAVSTQASPAAAKSAVQPQSSVSPGPAQPDQSPRPQPDARAALGTGQTPEPNFELEERSDENGIESSSVATTESPTPSDDAEDNSKAPTTGLFSVEPARTEILRGTTKSGPQVSVRPTVAAPASPLVNAAHVRLPELPADATRPAPVTLCTLLDPRLAQDDAKLKLDLRTDFVRFKRDERFQLIPNAAAGPHRWLIRYERAEGGEPATDVAELAVQNGDLRFVWRATGECAEAQQLRNAILVISTSDRQQQVPLRSPELLNEFVLNLQNLDGNKRQIDLEHAPLATSIEMEIVRCQCPVDAHFTGPERLNSLKQKVALLHFAGSNNGQVQLTISQETKDTTAQVRIVLAPQYVRTKNRSSSLTLPNIENDLNAANIHLVEWKEDRKFALFQRDRHAGAAKITKNKKEKKEHEAMASGFAIKANNFAALIRAKEDYVREVEALLPFAKKLDRQVRFQLRIVAVNDQCRIVLAELIKPWGNDGGKPAE